MASQKSPAPPERNAEPLGIDRFAADRPTGYSTSSGDASASRRTATSKLRRQHLAQQVYELGPKPMLHLLEEIAGGADLDERLERYAALPVDFIRQLGGDYFAPNVTLVRRSGE